MKTQQYFRKLSISLLSIGMILASNVGWAARNQSLFCVGGLTFIANFHAPYPGYAGTLPFPDGTIITSQFRNKGIVFSSDDSNLPPEFQRSTGSAENRIQDGIFYNPFRVNFIRKNVISVSMTLADHTGGRQIYSLGAFDSAGHLVDVATFTEVVGDAQQSETTPDPFTLTVSSCEGIAFVVAIEDPLGAARLDRITYTTGTKY